MADLIDFVEQRLRLMWIQFRAGAGIDSWCFDLQGRLLYSTCPYQEEVQHFLELGGCMDYLRSPERDYTKPAILSDRLGLVWAADYVWRSRDEKGNPIVELIIVIGPVFILASSLRLVDQQLLNQNYSIPVQSGIRRILHEIPVLSMSSLRQYASMLHASITMEPTRIFDFEYQQPEQIYNEEKEASEARLSRAEEELLMKDIEHGVLPQTSSRMYSFQSTDMNPQEARIQVQVHNALCARAAIRGGVPAAIADGMEKHYRERIEQARTVTALATLSGELRKAWAGKTREIQQETQISAPIKVACNYVTSHILENMSLQEIAAAAGYTDYYLTKKFQNEMGIRLIDYIKTKRIEYAKILLATGEKTIDEICEMMNYSSRSHFSRVFTQIVGQSPGAYRESVQHKLPNKEAADT